MKEIGYRTKEKIRFKTHINDDRQDIQRNRASQSFHLQEKKKYQDIM